MIKNIWKKIQSYIKKSTGVVMALGIFVVAITIFLVGNAFAALTPTKSVIITSQKTSYENNEPGSWQVEKSGKWISKGKARVTFDVDTTLMTEDKDTDIIFVLDISGSMSGDKLERVKADSTELIESLLSNKNNNAALITFDTCSTIVSDFTNDKDYLIQEINNLEDTGNTNYYQPLVNVDKILKDYVKTDDKEVIVLFLTDGYPNEDTPNQIAQYQTLKKNYPYITINGIQYEMGETILDPIEEISDNQFFADMETLNNVLFDASVSPISYDEFKIVDYIDNRYFTLKSEDDITVSQGSVKLEEENGKQKITWTIPSFKSGRDAKLTMDINLKDEYIGQGGIYPTNESEEIISKIINIPDEDVSSTKIPVLSDNYKVTYDGNSPDGSTVSNVPNEANYSVFDTVSLITEEPSCVGYEFKGWEIVNKDVTRVGEDHFIMPEEDVVIRAKWSKVEVSKSMNGTVNNMGDPIMKRYDYDDEADYHNLKYRSKVTSIVTKDNLEIPTTAIEYWDVSAAGDGSVVAYIEDDGSGNGTYKVTIGGQGGIIANPNSSEFLAGFSNNDTEFLGLEYLDLTYLDTSLVTNMYRMFNNCSSLKKIILGNNFVTSNVTNMDSMFYNCCNLQELDVSGFDTSKVENMGDLFYDCNDLLSIDVSGFDTSKVTDMSGMFHGCRSITELDVSHFNTANVENMGASFSMSDTGGSAGGTLGGMFSSCNNLTSLDLSNFDTSNVTNMDSMFRYCSKLSNIIFGSNWDTSNVTDMTCMFESCKIDDTFFRNIVSGFDFGNVIYLDGMFSSCTNLINVSLDGMKIPKAIKLSQMFSDCSNMVTFDFGDIDISKVKYMGAFFYSCSDLQQINFRNIDTSSFVTLRDFFSKCSSLTKLDLTVFNTSNVTDMVGVFNGCEKLVEINLSSFNTSKVTNMGGRWEQVDTGGSTGNGYGMFDSCTSLVKIEFGDFFDTSNVTNMNCMFRDCESLENLDLSFFNTSNVTDMGLMFKNCKSLTDLNLNGFDTSNVTNMSTMFSSCSSLMELDLSSFDTSIVTDMGYMFYYCPSLTRIDLSSFNTSNVTNMTFMFGGCGDLADLDLSTFNLSSIANMNHMFYSCSSLSSLDMRNSDFNSVTSYDDMFINANNNINVIVKDSAAEIFIINRFDDVGLSNATVTIANPTSQTSLFELGPREFGPFYLVLIR